MSTETLPSPTPVDADEDDICHIVCCDRDTALCGLEVKGEPELPWNDTGPECRLCRYLVGQPCGAVGCPG